jgi:hypothetical protein
MLTMIFTTVVVASGPGDIRGLDGLEKSIAFAQASEYARGRADSPDRERRDYVKSRLVWNLREIGPDDDRWVDDLVDRVCERFDAPKPVVIKAAPAPVLQEEPEDEEAPVAEDSQAVQAPAAVEQPLYYYVPQYYYVVPGCATGQCPR